MLSTPIAGTRIGFEVKAQTDGRVQFRLLGTEGAGGRTEKLVQFAEDEHTGNSLALMGRLYYRAELCRDACFVTEHQPFSDAALALAIFSRYGGEGLKRLEGEFVIVAYDVARRRLMALRDPMGSWPLYWCADGSGVRVSTSLYSLMHQLRHLVSVDLDFVADCIMYPFAFVELRRGTTALNPLQRVFPGTLLALYPDGRCESIWEWSWFETSLPPDAVTMPEAAEQFGIVFRGAVRERIVDESVAAHLSGGMDSSTVVCIARNLVAEGTPATLSTISLVFELASLAPEKEYIQLVVNQGGPIDVHYVRGDNLLDFEWFEEGVPEHDEPYAGLSQLAMERQLVKVASELGATIILSGAGAELTLQGHHKYLADLVRRGEWSVAFREAQRWAQARNESPVPFLLRNAFRPNLPAWLYDGFSPLIRSGYGRWPRVGSFTIPSWINPSYARMHAMREKGLAVARRANRYPFERNSHVFGLETSAGGWSAWYLAGARGIRTGRPFLDSRVVRFCLTLPRELREIPSLTKPVLTTAMKGVLPEPIRTRQWKRSFNDVYWTGLARRLPQLEEMILASSINDLEILDTRELVRVMRQVAAGIGDVQAGGRLNTTLAVIVWYDQVQRALRTGPQFQAQPKGLLHVFGGRGSVG